MAMGKEFMDASAIRSITLVSVATLRPRTLGPVVTKSSTTGDERVVDSVHRCEVVKVGIGRSG